MNADLHNLEDRDELYWIQPGETDRESLYDEIGDPDEPALNRIESELDQIERWINVAESTQPTEGE